MESSQPLPITGRHTPQHSTAGPPALDGKRRPSQPLIERPGLADLFDQTRAHSITQTSYMTKMTHTTRTHTQRNTAQHSGLRHPSDTLTQKPAPTATLLVYPGDKSMQAGLWAAWLGVLRSSVVPWVPWDGRHERLIDGGVDPHHLIGGRQTLACVLEPYQLGLARHGGRVVGVQAVAQHLNVHLLDAIRVDNDGRLVLLLLGRVTESETRQAGVGGHNEVGIALRHVQAHHEERRCFLRQVDGGQIIRNVEQIVGHRQVQLHIPRHLVRAVFEVLRVVISRSVVTIRWRPGGLVGDNRLPSPSRGHFVLCPPTHTRSPSQAHRHRRHRHPPCPLVHDDLVAVLNLGQHLLERLCHKVEAEVDFAALGQASGVVEPPHVGGLQASLRDEVFRRPVLRTGDEKAACSKKGIH
mmetsp:Transcript_27026/g.77658  ORF Transcript_27026/g.77658 Transcript_27026/m.77658 type:complete len:411 (+) Transcript_27026:2281-3513(+)